MRALLRSSLRTRSVWICAVIGTGLIFSYSALAPPARGAPAKKPVKRPAARPAAPKPGPPKRPQAKVKRPPHRPKHKRYVRRYRYWHPHYRLRTPKKIWTDIGYRYYVGGTAYVTLPPAARVVVPVEAAQPVVTTEEDATEAETLDTYVQIQELVELIHEWRTMNESPSLHQRLPAADASAAQRSVLGEINERNRAFDEQTRMAMRKLAGGASAELELESARGHLEKLIDLVESLPPPR